MLAGPAKLEFGCVSWKLKSCFPVFASTIISDGPAPTSTKPGTAITGASTSWLKQSCQRNAPEAGFKARKLPKQLAPLIVVLAAAAYKVVPSHELDETLFSASVAGAANRSCQIGPALIAVRSKA